MIGALLAFHAIVAVALIAGGDRLGRRALMLAAAPAAMSTVWAYALLSSSRTATSSVSWVTGLDLELAFRVGPLAQLLTIIVSGIGTLVFLYAYGYFAPDATGMGRFSATLLLFSAAMVGLVWADSVWTLFLFWEMTSLTSFLLVGFKDQLPAARLAARRALLITASGGLVLLAGLILLVDVTGTARLSEMAPVEGDSTAAGLAAVLALVAAATKSAQVPFHVWLPGAMVAPTPVSAYLHSATMVKAGVVLVALLSPVLAPGPWWQVVGVGLGSATMLWGAFGALRHYDAKLILAWGTISQLGFLIVLFTFGSAKAAFAGVAVLVAHALFKATLFMVVGEIDVRTGTRRIDELAGLTRTMPLAAATFGVAALSMIGIPPLLGFAAKEAAVEAVLAAEGVVQGWAAVAVITGSILTTAYTVRLALGLFGATGGPVSAGDEIITAPGRRLVSRLDTAGLAGPSVLLAVATIVAFAAAGPLSSSILTPAATAVDSSASVYGLIRWPGVNTALITSTVIVAAGGLLGVTLARRGVGEPGQRGADASDRLVDLVFGVARLVTRRMQHGSLPIYVTTIMAVAAAAAIPFAFGLGAAADQLSWSDRPLQIVLAVYVVVAAFSSAFVTSRFGAALALGLVGLGVSGLFAVHGASDLVLTQLLVETVVIVGFVVALGPSPAALPTRRPPVADRAHRRGRPGRRRRLDRPDGRRRSTVRAASGGRDGPSLRRGRRRQQHRERHPDRHAGPRHAGGDRRSRRRRDRHPRARGRQRAPVRPGPPNPPVPVPNRKPEAEAVPPALRTWSPPPSAPSPPLMIVVAVFLFFAGHNRPGGGFAAGLVLGALVAVRSIAGLAIPARPVALMASGVAVAGLVGAVPIVFGSALLDQLVVETSVPVLGTVKSGSALVFDLGVTLVVVGLVSSVLRGFGSGRPNPGRATEPAVEPRMGPEPVGVTPAGLEVSGMEAS